MREAKAAAIRQIQDKLDAMLEGRLVVPELNEAVVPQELLGIAQRINKLSHDITEMEEFGYDLARGKLDATTPSRTNYLSGPLKEIHSQLMTASYNMEQLLKGNMVGKLNLPGDFFSWYDLLIDKVSQTFGVIDTDQSQWGDSATSWRYHQILTAINKLSIMLLEVDADGRIVFANPNARETFADMKRLPYEDNSDAGALVGYLCSFAERIAQIDPGLLVFEDFPVLYELFDQEKGRWYKITSDVVNLADGSAGLLHVVDDISDWKKQEHQLVKSATIDPLTSTYTRSAGMRKLSEMVRLRDEERNCVAFADIDGLKEINDRYGHTEGDFVIKTVAQCLLSSVREADWVVRYGGDEFLVLLHNSGVKTARNAIGRMRDKLAAVNAQANKPYHMDVSVGISAITPDMRHAQDVIKVVDRDMYENKAAKRNGANADGE